MLSIPSIDLSFACCSFHHLNPILSNNRLFFLLFWSSSLFIFVSLFRTASPICSISLRKSYFPNLWSFFTTLPVDTLQVIIPVLKYSVLNWTSVEWKHLVRVFCKLYFLLIRCSGAIVFFPTAWWTSWRFFQCWFTHWLLPSQVFPSLHWYAWIFLLRCRTSYWSQVAHAVSIFSRFSSLPGWFEC